MFKNLHGYIAVTLPLTALSFVMPWYITSTQDKGVEVTTQTTVTFAEANETRSIAKKIRQGTYIVVHLDTNTLVVKNGSAILKTITIVSQGKPGSYYETIGGEYTSKFKEITHYSSIGHVFMPYSVHVFGNYFIHGIPYFPDGTKVSTAFSGGCIRLEDVDAEYIYNIVNENTPIIITRGSEDDFIPTSKSEVRSLHDDMTRIMTAVISLESLEQDNEIKGAISSVTRKELLSKILSKESFDASLLYANEEEKRNFIELMNSKARALGLTNTEFVDTNGYTSTTDEDYIRFMNYIRTYKSFLLRY